VPLSGLAWKGSALNLAILGPEPAFFSGLCVVPVRWDQFRAFARACAYCGHVTERQTGAATDIVRLALVPAARNNLRCFREARCRGSSSKWSPAPPHPSPVFAAQCTAEVQLDEALSWTGHQRKSEEHNPSTACWLFFSIDRSGRVCQFQQRD
jgi:hypothetical protein